MALYSKTNNSKSGFITLLSLLIAGAVGLAIAVSLITLGIDYSKSALVSEESALSKSLTNSCAEEALEKIRENQNYSGSSGINFGQGSCTYQVLNLGGQNRQINASGSVRNSIRKAKVLLNQVSPLIKASSWQEMADF